MKRTGLLSICMLLLVVANAQKPLTIKISGTKFPFDIMQQWIDVYGKTHPDVHFQLSKAIPTDSADLQIAAHSFRKGELNEDQVKISVNRYAQLR